MNGRKSKSVKTISEERNDVQILYNTSVHINVETGKSSFVPLLLPKKTRIQIFFRLFPLLSSQMLTITKISLHACSVHTFYLLGYELLYEIPRILILSHRNVTSCEFSTSKRSTVRESFIIRHAFYDFSATDIWAKCLFTSCEISWKNESGPDVCKNSNVSTDQHSWKNKSFNSSSKIIALCTVCMSVIPITCDRYGFWNSLTKYITVAMRHRIDESKNLSPLGSFSVSVRSLQTKLLINQRDESPLTSK